MSLKDKLANAKTVDCFPELSAEKKLRIKWLAQIAVAIRRKRMELGMSQKELAKYLGVSQAMVRKWENGEYNFTMKTLAKIYTKLDLSEPHF